MTTPAKKRAFRQPPIMGPASAWSNNADREVESQWSRANKTRRLLRLERQEKVVTAVNDGKTIAEAVGDVGVTVSTYNRWRATDKLFAAKIDAVRLHRATGEDVLRWQDGFPAFRKFFFEMDSPPIHIRICELIENQPLGTVRMILIPPLHGKSTLTEDWDCYKLANDPNFRITVGTEAQGHARKILGRVRGRMTDRNKAGAYIDGFGPFYVSGQERQGKPWGADMFTVYQASHDERDYSMEGRGMKAKIAGTRVDLLQIDDAQSLQSLNLTDALVENFRQDWLSRPSQEGRTVILGTRCGDWDFYEALQSEGIVDDLVCFPAILDSGEPLWPEKWPIEKLELQKRQVGEAAWWRNWMQAPRATTSATFADATLVDCRNPLLSCLPGTYERPKGVRVMTVDPALGGGNATGVFDLAPGRMIVRAIRSDFGLSRVEQILEIIDSEASRWRPDRLIIEANGYQRGLGNDDRLRAIASHWGMSVKPHQTQDNKRDPDFGVASMATDFLVRRIDTPYADEVSRTMTQAFEAELRAWRPNVRGNRLRMDRVMVAWFAWLEWRQMPQTSGGTTGFRRRGLPWTPTNVLRKVN